MEKTVLVVEDDVEINELLGEYLALEGLDVVTALNGQTAVDHIQALAQASDPTANPMTITNNSAPATAVAPLSAAILDLMLPDIDGYEICQKISSHRSTANIPIIILSCMNQDCDRRKGLALGAFRFMNKPFLPDDLIARVKEAFAWRKNIETKPSCGQFEISTANPDAIFYGINDLIADVFTHTQLSDAAVNEMREGFDLLMDWALAWGLRTKRDPRLLIQYRLRKTENGELLTATPCTPAGTEKPVADTAVLEWIISELEPGLLSEYLLRTQPVVAPAGKMQLDAKAGLLTTILRGVVGKENKSVVPTPPSQPTTTAGGKLLTPDAPVPGLEWWQKFLGKIGAVEMVREPQIRQIKLLRRLSTDNPSGLSVTTGDARDQVNNFPALSVNDTRLPKGICCETTPTPRK